MLTCDSQLPWYLVYCKAQEDRRARENLERQGFECFLPVRTVERCRNGRKVICTEPLFPRYLFIHLNSVNDNWYPIRSTRGVSGIVRFNEHPLPVCDEMVSQIRSRVAACTSPDLHLHAGEPVQIVEGAFARVEAIFLAHSGDERVTLLLNILQTDHRVTIPLRSVRKLG